MTQIEIILINDFSSDNTSYIVENLQKNDQRIKIINNIRNMGTLYSRSIGALASRGEYIFNLDNDDIYFSHDLFDSIYKIGKNENLDIISFLAINIWNYSSNVIYMKNLFSIQFSDEFYLKQPDLGMWIIIMNIIYTYIASYFSNFYFKSKFIDCVDEAVFLPLK